MGVEENKTPNRINFRSICLNFIVSKCIVSYCMIQHNESLGALYSAASFPCKKNKWISLFESHLSHLKHLFCAAETSACEIVMNKYSFFPIESKMSLFEIFFLQ